MNALKQPEIIWFIIGLVLLVSEFVVPGFVVFFFGVGAWIVAMTCLFWNIGINTQLIIFIISSVVSLVALRKWVTGIFKGHIFERQNSSQDLEDYVGQRAIVKKKIQAELGGRVEFHGTDWDAQADSEISEGTIVQIIGKENLTLKVKTL